MIGTRTYGKTLYERGLDLLELCGIYRSPLAIFVARVSYGGETVTVLGDGAMRVLRRYDVLLEGEIRGFVIDLPQPREWLQWLPHRVR